MFQQFAGVMGLHFALYLAGSTSVKRVRLGYTALHVYAHASISSGFRKTFTRSLVARLYAVTFPGAAMLYYELNKQAQFS